MTAAPAFTTTHVPPRSGEVLPETLPPRPDDADSLRVFLDFSARQVWPDGAARVVQLGAAEFTSWAVFFIDARCGPFKPPPNPYWRVQGGFIEWPDYLTRMAWYGLECAALATVLVRVGPFDKRLGPNGETWTNDLHTSPAGGVSLESWVPLDPSGVDTADMWRWAVATGESGPQAAKNAARLLPGALSTAQQLHDLTTLYLPLAAVAAEESSPIRGTEPTRRNRWA